MINSCIRELTLGSLEVSSDLSGFGQQVLKVRLSLPLDLLLCPSSVVTASCLLLVPAVRLGLVSCILG
jgi:hypothetical protein